MIPIPIIRLLLHIMPPFLIVNTTHDNGLTFKLASVATRDLRHSAAAVHHSGPFLYFLCVNLFTPIYTNIALHFVA